MSRNVYRAVLTIEIRGKDDIAPGTLFVAGRSIRYGAIPGLIAMGAVVKATPAEAAQFEKDNRVKTPKPAKKADMTDNAGEEA